MLCIVLCQPHGRTGHECPTGCSLFLHNDNSCHAPGYFLWLSWTIYFSFMPRHMFHPTILYIVLICHSTLIRYTDHILDSSVATIFNISFQLSTCFPGSSSGSKLS